MQKPVGGDVAPTGGADEQAILGMLLTQHREGSASSWATLVLVQLIPVADSCKSRHGHTENGRK